MSGVHEDLLAGGGPPLSELEKAAADKELALSDTDMDTGEHKGVEEVSPVIKTSQNGSYRLAMIFDTLFPGKIIHNGRFIPLHPAILRLVCAFSE